MTPYRQRSSFFDFAAKEFSLSGFLPIIWYKIPWFFPDISLIPKEISLINKNTQTYWYHKRY